MSSPPPVSSMPATSASLNIGPYSQSSHHSHSLPSHYLDGSELGHNGINQVDCFWRSQPHKCRAVNADSSWTVRSSHQSFSSSVQSSLIASHQMPSHSAYPTDPFNQPMLNILNANPNSAGHTNSANNELQYSVHNSESNAWIDSKHQVVGPTPWPSTALTSARTLDSNSWPHNAFVTSNSGYPQTNSYFIWSTRRWWWRLTTG